MRDVRGSVLILAAGASLAVFTWLLDSVVDYTTAAQGLTFLQMVFTPPLHAVFARSMLAVTILCVSWATSRVLATIDARNRRIVHLNSVLQVGRDANRLLVREHDIETLLSDICSLLVRERGYEVAWIVHLEADGQVAGGYSAGLSDAQDRLQFSLERRETFPCMELTADRQHAVVLTADDETCAACPMRPQQRMTKIVCPVRHGERLFGLLCVAMETDAGGAAEECDLVDEIAHDLALSLHGIEVETELRRNEERFRLLFDQSADAIFIHDLDGVVVDVNQTACDLLGYEHDELIGMAPRRLVAEGMFDRIKGPIDELRRTGTIFVETALARSDGSVVPVEMNARVIKYGDETRLLAIVRDITQRKRAEEELRELSNFREAIIDQANTAVVVFDPTGQVVVWNRAMGQITGYTAEDVMGRDAWGSLLTSDEEVRSVQQMLHSVVEKGETFRDIEVSIRTAGGEDRLMSWHARRLADEAGRPMGAVAIGRDVTEQRELKRRLERAQRLEAIGRLAGGVAHDFNNMLTAIIGNAELMESEPLSEPLRESLAEIRGAAQRSVDLTRQLLTFGGKARMEPTTFDLNAVARDLQPMLRKLTREDISLEFDLTPEGAPVRADRSQIEQVLLNLVVNARDAMPDGGSLTVRTARVDITSTTVASTAGPVPGPHVTLAVSDTGRGMDEATQARIFEPFFTTNENGTGLGLATVYGAVQENGGDIDVSSTVGEGTTFTVYLPLAVTRPADEKLPRREPGPRHGQSRLRVLLVEDEAHVRRLVASMLESAGHEVISAATGVEALQRIEEFKAPPDLLLADVVMPQMGGVELTERLRAERPDLPVLLISGYAPIDPPEGVRLLQKPFSPKQLLDAVDEVMAGRSSG